METVKLIKSNVINILINNILYCKDRTLDRYITRTNTEYNYIHVAVIVTYDCIFKSIVTLSASNKIIFDDSVILQMTIDLSDIDKCDVRRITNIEINNFIDELKLYENEEC